MLPPRLVFPELDVDPLLPVLFPELPDRSPDRPPELRVPVPLAAPPELAVSADCEYLLLLPDLGVLLRLRLPDPVPVPSPLPLPLPLPLRLGVPVDDSSAASCRTESAGSPATATDRCGCILPRLDCEGEGASSLPPD